MLPCLCQRNTGISRRSGCFCNMCIVDARKLFQRRTKNLVFSIIHKQPLPKMWNNLSQQICLHLISCPIINLSFLLNELFDFGCEFVIIPLCTANLNISEPCLSQYLSHGRERKDKTKEVQRGSTKVCWGKAQVKNLEFSLEKKIKIEPWCLYWI